MSSPGTDALHVRLAKLERERRVAEALLQMESLDLHDVLDRICHLTVELMPCDRATVYLYSSRTRGFVPMADRGTPPHIFERFAQRFYFGKSRAGAGRDPVPFRDELVAGRIGYCTRADAPTPEMRALLEELEQEAMCLVPLRGGQQRGAIFVTTGQPAGFDDTALWIADAVARQGAKLVDHARTFLKLRHAARQRAGIAALAAAVNLETRPEGIARLVCAEVAQLFRFSAVAILVPQGDGLVILGGHGPATPGLELPLDPTTPLLAAAFRDGAATYVNELADTPAAAGPLCRDLGLRSAAALPLIGRERPIGCLLLGSTERAHGFGQELLDETLVLGAIVSAALERAALFRQVERSEEQFRSLIENASDLIEVFEPDGVLRYQSPSVERILGWPPEARLGRPFDELVHPDDAAALRADFAAVLAGRPGTPRESRFRRRDGAWRVLEGVSTLVRRPDGRPTVVVNSRDVTERRRTQAREAGQKQVLERFARGESLEDVLATLVDVIDADLNGASAVLVLEDDGTALRLVAGSRLPAGLRDALARVEAGPAGGCAGAAVTLRHRVVVTAGEARPRAWATDPGATAGQSGCWAEPILSATGEMLGVLVRYQPAGEMRPADGELGFLEVAAHLASIAIERTRAARELATARDEALSASRLKSEFLANMSHEIRTPMNGVIGMADLLAESNLDEEQRDFVTTIRASAEGLLTVINDILDFSKIEAGKMTIEKVGFDLRQLLEEIADLLAPRAAKKGLELSCAVPPALPERLIGDPHRLRQVLTNLIGNAIKFTDTGRITLVAETLGETPTHAELRLSVRDTGIGIPKERQGAIFESFTQADGSMTRRYGGTGLGLTISRQLVQLMDGRIGLSSEPGAGSTFWIEMTFEKQHGAPARGPAAPVSLTGLRVLVVDDYDVNRRIYCEQLRSWGCVANEASSGAAAIAALRAAAATEPYELVLLDMNMPEMDGEMTAATIHADPRLAGTPLVLLSSMGSRTAEDARRMGFAAALSKPVRRAHLLNVVSSLAGKASRPARTAGPASDAQTRLGLRVLLAEDNAVNRQVALQMLARLGCQATAVNDGVEALAALEREEFDVVLMDVQMPNMDGFEAAAHIRRREAGTGRHVVILAMTAHAREEDRRRCLAAQMDGYVAKPVRMSDLARALAPFAPAAGADAAAPRP